ncbi:centromere-associated protein E-like isoform X1 [Ischnura elegans]|uniref:centromere-associated protein E-like isoform X1 n=1 Tax=Ischnura elegans TaxID=197161 RepID=UPI001ED89AC7|nr:centromere-associated protein E-like isoform X1 [Ischnura elegans]
MDENEATASSQEAAPKKRQGLEAMSKEELIKKCRNLLTIAQKAKEAKDDANEEVKALKEKLNQIKSQHDGKKPQVQGIGETKDKQLEKQITAMQEMINNLTEQKLQFAMEMDSFKKKTSKLEEELRNLREKEKCASQRVSELEIERDGFERQARRLEKEAESLTFALDETEKRGNEALSKATIENEKLKKDLEKLVSKNEVPSEVDNQHIEKEDIKVLQKEIDFFISKVTESGEILDSGIDFRTFNPVWQVIVHLRNHNFELGQEVAECKKIEFEKNCLLTEISVLKETAAKMQDAQNQIMELTEEKEVLSSQIQSLKAALAVFNESKEKLASVEAENEVLYAKLNEFKNEAESLKERQASEEVEMERNALKVRVDELMGIHSACEKEKSKLVADVEHLQALCAEKSLCEKKLEEVLSENRILHRNICQTKEEMETCQNEISKFNVERETLNRRITELMSEGENMEIKLVEAMKGNEKLCDEMKLLKDDVEASKSLKVKFAEIQTEKEILEEKVNGLQSSIEKSGVEREELLKEASERDAQLKDLVKETKEKLNTADAEKAALKTKIDTLEQNCHVLSEKNKSSQEEIKSLVEKLEELEVALEQLRGDKEAALADIEAVKLENKALRDSSALQVKTLEEEKSKLEQELQKAVSSVGRNSSLETKLAEVESDRRAVISERDSLRMMLTASEGERDQFREQNSRLNETLVNLEERLRAAEEGAEGVREALENKVNSLQSTLREKEALELQLTEMNETLVRTKSQVQEIEDAKNLLEGESRSLRESLKEQNKVLERLREVEEGKDGMEREIETLRASLKEECVVKARLEAEKISLEEEVATLKMAVKDEDKVMERLREVEEEKDGMEREIQTLRNNLKEVMRNETEEKEVLRERLEAALLSEGKMKDMLHTAADRSSSLEKEVEDLKLTLKENSTVKEELKEALARKELLEKEGENLKSAQEEFSKLEELLNKSTEEKTKLSKINEEMASQIEILQKKVQDIEVEKQDLGKTLQDLNNMIIKWEEVIDKFFSENVLDQITSSTQPEGNIQSTSLVSDVENLSSSFISADTVSEHMQVIIPALKKSLSYILRINKMSEGVADSLKQSNNEKAKVKKEMEKKLQKLKCQHEDFRKKKESELAILMRDIMAIRESIGVDSNLDSDANSILARLQDTSVLVKKMIGGLNEEKVKLEGIITAMKSERETEKAFVKDLEGKVKELEEAKYSAEQQLITEMKDANTVLKKRGEAIAALEAELAKLKSQLAEAQSKKQAVPVSEALVSEESTNIHSDPHPQSKEDVKKGDNLEGECKYLRLRVSELEKQVNSMSVKGSNICDTVGSEVLSTSTISKTEEAARLRDVEESFEDRYTKLRMVAVKLKKRCTELEGERKRADELQGRLNNLSKEITNLSTQAKNAKSLQLECDRLQDKVDELGKENISLKKALKESVDESTANKIQLQEIKEEKNRLASTVEVINKEKNSAENSLLEAVSKRKNAEKEIQKLEQDLHSVKAKLNQEEASRAEAVKQLEEGKQTWKRGNVLSLEMAALEQSAVELRRQLEESLQEGSKLKESLRQAEEDLLKSKLKEEEAKLTRDLLKETQGKLTDCEKLKTEACESVERLRREVETQSLQLVKLMAESKRQNDSYRTQQEAVLAQASALEAQVTRLRSELVEKNMELEQVRSDFAAYKVRAQAVLLRKEQEREAEGSGSSRRDKEEEEAKEQEWERERRQLERVADGLKRTLEDATSQLEEVQADRETLHEKCQTLELECQRLRDSFKELEDHNKEEAFQSRIKVDTLVRSYQQQLEELQNKYRTETLSLREQVEKLKAEKEALVALQSSFDIHKKNKDDQMRGSGGHRPWPLAADTPLDGRLASEMALHPREEGEGSESVESPPSPHSSYNSRSHANVGGGGRRKKKGLVPLDQLLSSSLPDEEETDGGDQDTLPGDEEDGNVGDWISGHRSSYNVVATLERRAKHLSVLLSEAESEGARLAQQNALLKEEVRRLERCAERTEHTQNAEYLKNVLLKFITLQGGDERSRLVPVLTTILKLSPEETHQLNAVASGGSMDSGQAAGAGRGWGSYLHLWPSAP